MIWELIFKISVWFLIVIAHIIPALIAIYYLIKEKQWFLLIPMSIIFAIPLLGSLASYVQIISEGEEFNLGDMPLIAKIIFFVPLNLLVISAIMVSI